MNKDIEVLLTKLESIAYLNAQQKDAVSRLPLHRVSFERGAEAVVEGMVMRHCCIVLSGLLHRQKTMRDGSRQILSFHPAGDIPDLQSLHLRKVDSTLTATTTSAIGMIQHDDIHALLRAHPDLTSLFWRDTLIDAARFLTWIMLVGQATAEAKMAHLFCEMYCRLKAIGLVSGAAFLFPVTQAELADAVGISIVHANRTLQQLRADALLSFNNGQVEILNWKRLSDLAQFDPSYLHLSGE